MESWAVHVVHGRARVHGYDEDDVGQVKKEGDSKSGRLLVRWKCKRLEGVKAWQRLDTQQYQRQQVYRFGPQNQVAAGLLVCASKPSGDKFADLGLKT